MIAALVEAAVARLREELGGVLDDPARRVAAGPAPAPEADALPLLVLSPGPFQVSPAPAETTEAGVRPVAAAQRFAVSADAPGPFPLDHAPLPGTARGRLALAEGTVAERGELLVEGAHFTVDYPASTVAFTPEATGRAQGYAAVVAGQVQARVGRSFNLDSPKELSGALYGDLGLPTPGEPNAQGYWSTARTVLEPLRDRHPVVPLVLAYRELKGGGGAAARLDYAFAGVFAEREFRQSLLLDAYAATAAEAERWASLAAGVLLTFQAELLEARAEHLSKKAVSTLHEAGALELVEGAPEAVDAGVRVRLSFRVGGRLRVVREDAQSYAVIERIRSPGTFSTEPVAIDPEIA